MASRNSISGDGTVEQTPYAKPQRGAGTGDNPCGDDPRRDWKQDSEPSGPLILVVDAHELIATSLTMALLHGPVLGFVSPAAK